MILKTLSSRDGFKIPLFCCRVSPILDAFLHGKDLTKSHFFEMSMCGLSTLRYVAEYLLDREGIQSLHVMNQVSDLDLDKCIDSRDRVFMKRVLDNPQCTLYVLQNIAFAGVDLGICGLTACLLARKRVISQNNHKKRACPTCDTFTLHLSTICASCYRIYPSGR
jgi:hypothetical protein